MDPKKKYNGIDLLDESMHPMPSDNSKADSRYKAVMSHAKKMEYKVHHNEGKGDGPDDADITVHYQRGDTHKTASPEAIEVNKGGKATKDATLKAHIKGASLSEATVGGGQTGVSKSAEPTGVKAKAPGNSKDQGEKTPQKIEGENCEETSSENNTKPTGNAAAGNKSSVSMKEDMAIMFDGEELSEEFKEKATTFFEAAVHARIEEEVARLEEEYNTSLEEQVAAIAEDLSEKMNDYTDYVVEQWLEENEVAIETSLKSEITEDFINALKQVFVEHYIDIPEDKVNVVEELAAQVEELTTKLNTSIEEQIVLQKQIDEQTAQLVFAEVSEGLATTQADKFKTLAEGVEFNGAESYRQKLATVKESYFSGKKPTQLIVESEIDSAEHVEAPVVVPAAVASYVSAISRTIKK